MDKCLSCFAVQLVKLQVAQIKGLSAEEVAAITTENAMKLFPKLRQRLVTVAAAAKADDERAAAAIAGTGGSPIGK